MVSVECKIKNLLVAGLKEDSICYFILFCYVTDVPIGLNLDNMGQYLSTNLKNLVAVFITTQNP